MAAIAGDSAVLADHLELLITAHPGQNFPRRRMEEVAGKLWDADSAHVNIAFNRMDERAKLLGSRYPLKVSRAYAVTQHEAPVYQALLGLTRTNWFYGQRDLDGIDTTKNFEQLAERCLANFFGPSTQSVNFGWPTDVGRPMEFSRAIAWLAERIGIPVGAAYRQPRRKDGGVDIVVWRSFGDNRPGVPLMLVQATVQVDVVSKSRDVNRRLWAGWLATDVDPMVALAIPGTVTNAEHWNEISQNSLLLDRIRLTSLAGDDVSTAALCSPIVDATHRVLHEALEDS